MDFETLEITYGGKPMLAPDPNGELMAHINRHFSHFFEPANPLTYAPSNLRQTCCDNRPPLVLPRWNQEPRLGLYQLYMPCGFTRHEKMYGLLDAGAYKSLFGGSANSAGELRVTIHEQVRPGDAATESFLYVYFMKLDAAIEITQDVLLVRLIGLYADDVAGVVFDPDIPKPSRMTIREFLELLDSNSPQLIRSFANVWLESLPDYYIDLDALWRPGELCSVLAEACLGVFATRVVFWNHSFNDAYNKIDAHYWNTIYPNSEILKLRRPKVLYRHKINGRVTCNAFESSSFGSAIITTSAPWVPGSFVNVGLNDIEDTIQIAESRFAYGIGYRRVGTYERKNQTFKAEFQLGYDSQIIDLNPAGGGRVSSFIPVQAFPIQRHYYWIGDEKPTCEPHDTIRVQLLEDLPVCGDAAAFHLSDLAETEGCPCGPVRQVLVIDTAGIARTRILNGQRFSPAQSMGFAKHLKCSDTGDENVYELISIGQGCCPEPTSSDYTNCCHKWFTRFTDVDTVTGKAVGAEIAYGEAIAVTQSTGSSYKAYLSNSDAYDGCAIDLSSIHAIGTKNSRADGTSPCTPGFTQCEIDYALLKMSGRLPVDPSSFESCKEIYEDLSAAGTGDDYYRRTIKGGPVESCFGAKKIYNFSNAKTTILTKGADYIVLKHECDPTSQSSSSGVDSCCVLLTDYDMRCVGGVLQRWKQETEVCWNGDCLEKRIVSEWADTGERAGCCDCGSSSASSSSGAVVSSSSACGCCYTFSLQESLDGGGLCGEPAGGNVCGCVEFTSYPTQVCSGGAWSVTFQLSIEAACAGDLTGAVLTFPSGWTITNGGGGSVSGQTVTFTTTDTNATLTVSGTIDEFYSCGGATASIEGYVTPPTIERGTRLTYSCNCFTPCTIVTTCCPDNPIPEILNVTISGGSCAGTYTMFWLPESSEWFSEDFPGTMRMSCTSGDPPGWYLVINMDAYPPTTESCDPFSLSFTIIGDPICGNMTITITG